MMNIVAHRFSLVDLTVAKINDEWLPLVAHAEIGITYVSMDDTGLVDRF